MVGVDHNDVAKLFQAFPNETNLATNEQVWKWVAEQTPETRPLYSRLLWFGVRKADSWDFRCPLCKLDAGWTTQLGSTGIHTILAGIGCGDISKTSCVCPKCNVDLELTLHANMKADAVANIKEDLMSLLPRRDRGLQVDAVLLNELHGAIFRERFPNVKVARTSFAYPPAARFLR